ncbi:MAG: polyphosphate kinase 1 [Coriobacteriales bacterium]|jgi:polyphosphate kinase
MGFTQNRELSWLNFNKRVLEIGADPQTPLFEKLKFVSIFQSNLSEFFMIRVGGLHDLASLKKDVIDNKSGMTASEQLDAIYAECVPLEKLRDEVFADVESQLWHHDVRRFAWEGLNPEQRAFVEEYASKLVLPILSPQIIDPRHPFPHLQNGELYVVVQLTIPADEEDVPEQTKQEKKKKKGKPKVQKSAKQAPLLGIIPVPTMVPRIVQLPGEHLDYMLMEEVIRHYAPIVFDMYDAGNAAVISVTRNADINPDDETYDDDDYRKHMKKILKKRKRLAPVRLVEQGGLAPKLRKYFCKQLDLSEEKVFSITSPIDLSYVFKLEQMLTPDQQRELLYTPYAPIFSRDIDQERSMFDQIRENDILLSYPYDSIDPFLNLLKEASTDPEVISIKITLYRLANVSKVAEYLTTAADNGKDVVILMELRARFDEEANIGWAERFEEAGCTVLYGFEGYKVHTKICQITRRREKGVEFFTQLGTGNYNEKTAAQYTDLCLMTADGDIGFDGVEFFNNMAMGNLDGEYKKMLVAPISLKSSIMQLIDDEMEKVRAGGTGSIILKCNSVTDLDIINKLSEASQAGVQVEMIVRGICCILPGVEGETDNISVTSIVGRLLEHSRIYCFGEGDDMRIYLSSADLMTRNTERRVEIAFPVENASIRERVYNMLQVQLSDNERAQRLSSDGSYARVVAAEGEEPVNAQSYFMQEAIQKAVWVQPEMEEVESVVAEETEEEPVAAEPEAPVSPEPKKKGFFSRIGAAFRRLFGRSDAEREAPEPAALLEESKDE